MSLVKFGDLQIGDAFRWQACRFRKDSEQTACLVSILQPEQLGMPRRTTCHPINLELFGEPVRQMVLADVVVSRDDEDAGSPAVLLKSTLRTFLLDEVTVDQLDDGHVILRGDVPSKADRHFALALARSTRGVATVSFEFVGKDCASL